MKDEEIIALALEKGERVVKSFKSMNEVFYVYEFSKPELLAFARAIADMQKEKDAKICDMVKNESSKVFAGHEYIHGREMAAVVCADAIRSAK